MQVHRPYYRLIYLLSPMVLIVSCGFLGNLKPDQDLSDTLKEKGEERIEVPAHKWTRYDSLPAYDQWQLDLILQKDRKAPYLDKSQQKKGFGIEKAVRLTRDFDKTLTEPLCFAQFCPVAMKKSAPSYYLYHCEWYRVSCKEVK